MDKTLKESIDRVHSRIVDCAMRIIDGLVQNSVLLYPVAQEFLRFAEQLETLLPIESRPAWLSEVTKFYEANLNFRAQDNKAGEFAVFVLTNVSNIKSPILTPDEMDYDFDLAFETARDASGIPATFDSLVKQLEEIIALDVIEIRIVQEAIERLKAMLNRNRHGSLASILMSIHYGRFVLKAFEGVLCANKHLKPVVDAFKEELAKAESKVNAAEARLKEVAIRRLTNERRLMNYLAENGGESTVAGFLTGKPKQL